MSTQVHTLIGAYVLDAVDDVTRVSVERHLATCEECSADVAELREVAARLGEAVAAPPPVTLRERVLSEVGRTRQLPPTGRTPGSGYVDLARWRRWTAAAVAACLLAVGAGVAAWSIQHQRVVAERATAEAERARADAERARADAERSKAAEAARREAAIAAVLSADDAVVRDTEVAGGGRVSVVVSASLDRAVVVLSGLAAVERDRAYQLWLITGRSARSAGVLPAGQSGATRLLDGLGDAELLGVTEEPAGGSPQPTSTPVAAVELR